MRSQPTIRPMRLVFQWLLVLILLISNIRPASAAGAEGDPGFWPDPGNLAVSYSPRVYHTAVWTGTEMIVWGGMNAGGERVNTGARYNLETNTWTPVSTINAPAGRFAHTAVWTGTEMIVWGGLDSSNHFVNTGGSYNPETDTWTPISTINAPAGRFYHTAVWSGTEMIVWGGIDIAVGVFNTGGRYNPDTDTWESIPVFNAPSARAQHTAVWTGTEMIVWGGTEGSTYFNTGKRYNPSAPEDVAWTPITSADAPDGRAYHTAVWTGTEMIVWGGKDSTGYLNTGGRYDPVLATWTPTATTNAPAGRYYHTALWTGTEMMVWGGGGGDLIDPVALNTGGRYNPCTSDDAAWTPIADANAPASRIYHAAVWTGTAMIVWGGYDGSQYFGTGGYYYANNALPIISDIPDLSATLRAPIAAIAFTVDDRETGAATLTLQVTSSNPTLLPDENILLEGSGADRTLTITPVAGETGETTIQITASDGVNTAIGSFVLSVNPHRVWLPLLSKIQ